MTSPLPPVVVLGLNYPPEPTGISPYTGALAAGLAARGHETRALTTHPHYPDWHIRAGYGQWSRNENIDHVTVERLLHYVPRQPRRMSRLLSEISFGLRLALRSWGRPGAVVAVSPALFSSAVAYASARLRYRSVPFIVWVQDLYSQGLAEFDGRESAGVRLARAVERWLLGHADRVVVIHDRFVPRVRDDLGVSADRISVIRNWTHLPPIPEVDVAAARAGFGWSEGEKVVLHCGNMGVKQGLENVVEAARLAAQRGDDVRFVLVGDGSERARLQKLGAGIPTLQFLPPLDSQDFPAALRAADVLLVNERPGVSEMAVPSKLTSYFSAGRPVLAATDPLGITAEEVRAAGAGVAVQSGAPDVLLDAAIALVADSERAAAYGESAQRYRETVLDADFAIDRFATLVSTLASAAPAAAAVGPATQEPPMPALPA
ncbi:glycosyltransferase [Microbacterium sp. NPDC055683]